MIHLAFKHDIAFSGGFEDAADADRRAIDTFGEALTGSDRPLLIASGTLGLAPGRVATEQDGQESGPVGAHLAGGPAKRLANAHATVALADRGVRSSVVRLLPPFTATGTTGSSPPWSPSPAKRASPAT